MKVKSVLVRWGQICALGWLGATLAPPAPGAEVNLAVTNWSERWITNVVEIWMPSNRFVHQFRTNWVAHVRTNRVAVNAFLTNVVDAYRTNWRTVTLTNAVAVQAFRTNVVDRYRTNWKTLTLTNWETVVVMKTNWVTERITNLAEIDLPRQAAMPPETPAAKQASFSPAARSEPNPSLPPATLTNALVLEATGARRAPANDQVEVQMHVTWLDQPAVPIKVHQWRVEREDGAILCFGQDREFKRPLPVGAYKVEVRVQRAGNGPLLMSRGILLVTLHDAAIQQPLTARR